MAAIKQLLDHITDESLRRRLAQEINILNKQKKFGLVFEEHLPECTLLYDTPVRRGSIVARRDGKACDLYRVLEINGITASCVHGGDNVKAEFPVSDLVVASHFGEPVYPYLKPVDNISRAPGDPLWHTLIEADNFHALQLLDYLYRGKVDCIYIDPPYNTGARDWKYNNDYVDSSDQYRHSKWLSMMEKRLRLAKRLLNPQDSVLIVTIDEKEYLHLGCLLEEMFPEANIQMVTNVISGKGVSRDGQFSRVEEFIFCVTLGKMQVTQLECNMLQNEDSQVEQNPIDFLGFRRRNKGNFRTSRPNQFYPVIVDNTDGHIVKIGDVVTPEINRADVEIPDGCTGLWPLDPNGQEKIWSLVPESARTLLEKGCIKVVNWKADLLTGTVKYLASGTVEKIDNGQIVIDERDKYGAILKGHSVSDDADTARPRRVWYVPTHNASSYGTLLIKKFLTNKRFDFPKSLYAVHDTLRFFVANKPDALIVDFFAGSGTTLHAVNLLNKEDGGHRRCIMVTNNEVSEEESKSLTVKGYRQGDEEWEKLGIARYVTWPRTTCSINGIDVKGNPIKGNYLTYKTEEKTSRRSIRQISLSIPAEGKTAAELKKQIVGLLGKNRLAQSLVKEDCPYILSEDYPTSILFDAANSDEWLEMLDGQEHLRELFIVTSDDKLFRQIKASVEDILGDYTEQIPLTYPMQDGFAANVEYFKLGFLDKNAIAMGRQFREILPLLWLKAGAKGKRPQIAEDEDMPSMLVLPENGFAVLTEEGRFNDFRSEVEKTRGTVSMAFIVTDSENGFIEMNNELQGMEVYQLYRDYLDNFRINLDRL